ncbi:MAG TPA: LuxR C-terminal-related transcriptional regulator [Trebonia sp.]|nr:LuxR C-terminal-related transcriptional regulator [Trebonia sp.]
MTATVGYQVATVPPLPPRHVSRPRLLAALDRAADAPITLLCAGPGAGKTVLLAEWVKNLKARVTWVTPGRADAEPERFWRLLESALPPGDEQERGAAFEPAADSAFDPVRMLFSQVTDEADPLIVVIDDAHVLTHPDVLDGIDRFVKGWNPGLRLVLAARSDPLLPLHRYRLAGQLAELRAADLAMTREEIGQVLAAHGVSLPEPDFDLLVARTEGWAAGVRLSAMRMQGTERPADFVVQLALDVGSIGEYLVDEVVQRLPEDHRRLLIETSFLDEVTGPLADAVTGLAGCGEMLTGLARDNAFVFPLDPTQTRYRYHQMFREILRYLLQRREGSDVRLFKERAAAWFEAEGDLGSAVYWAVQAEDRSRVASLFAGGGLGYAFAHRQDLSGLRLRELIPASESAEHDVATFAAEAVSVAAEGAAAELGRLRAWRSEHPHPDPELLVSCDLAELILGQKACDAAAVDGAAARILGGADAGTRRTPGLRAAVLLAQAATHFWHGRHEDVGALLDQALAEARRDGPDVLELEVLSMTAYVDSFWARTNRAEAGVQAAHALRKGRGLGVPPLLDLATGVRALIAGDLGGKDTAAQRVALPCGVGADPALEAAFALVLAGGLFAHRREDEARAVVHQQAESVLPPVLRAQRDILLADLDTASGRPRSALARLDGYRGTEFAVITAPAAARAGLASNDARAARDCVRSVLTSPSAQTGRLALLEAMLCDAQIAQLAGDEGRALEILIRALDVGRGEIILPFLKAGDTFAALLARHPDVGAQWPVAVADDGPASVPSQRIPHELPDPLTQRELTVLRLLATTMSTVEIADELCLSVNTVKTHLAAIYRKLPASRRREAVLRARELELI